MVMETGRSVELRVVGAWEPLFGLVMKTAPFISGLVDELRRAPVLVLSMGSNFNPEGKRRLIMHQQV